MRGRRNEAGQGSRRRSIRGVPRLMSGLGWPMVVAIGLCTGALAAQPKPAPATKPDDKSADKPPVGSAAPAKATSDDGTGDDHRTMDTLLDEAVNEQLPSPAAAKAKKDAEHRKSPVLPETPSPEGLRSAIKVLVPAVRGCAMGGRGRVDLIVVLRSDGTVESAQVAGPPYAGTAGGRCMEGAMKKVRFPAFTRPRMRLRIPFMIR